MDKHNLDDTYDLLSPLRRSHEYQSDSFESSDDDVESSVRRSYPQKQIDSFSLSESSKILHPKYASTGRYQGGERKYKISGSPKPKKQMKRVTSPLKVHDTTHDLMRLPEERDNTDLSVWEDWLIKKLQLERERNLLLKKTEREAKAEEERKMREKDDQKKRAEIKHQHWCEEKILKLKLQKTMEKREKLLKEELKAQEKDEINRKAKAAYEKWCEQQEEKERDAKQKEKERKDREKAEREERRKRNEECFQEWLSKVNERHAQSPRPKSSGPKEYPSPSFQNPKPWIGPLADRDTRESVRRQHKMLIAEKHAAIRRNRPESASQNRKGLVKTGPQKGKGVLICRPATAAPLFYNVPNRNNRKFTSESRGGSKGRS